MMIETIEGQSVYVFNAELKKFIEGKEIIDLKFNVCVSDNGLRLYTCIVMYKGGDTQ